MLQAFVAVCFFDCLFFFSIKRMLTFQYIFLRLDKRDLCFYLNLLITFLTKVTSSVSRKLIDQQQAQFPAAPFRIFILKLCVLIGRASHWYRGGHGFESRWSPDFFQASSFQLLKLEIYCDDHVSPSHLQPQFNYELFHIYFTSKLFVFIVDLGLTLIMILEDLKKLKHRSFRPYLQSLHSLKLVLVVKWWRVRNEG